MKKKFLTALFWLSAGSIGRVFAETANGDAISIAELDSALNKILGILTGTPTKVIASIVLVILAIGFVFSSDAESMKKRFLAWAIGIAIILASSAIIDIFWQGALL